MSYSMKRSRHTVWSGHVIQYYAAVTSYSMECSRHTVWSDHVIQYGVVNLTIDSDLDSSSSLLCTFLLSMTEK